MFLEWTVTTVHLIFFLAVNTLERISTRFLFLCFKPQRICLEIGFIIPCYFSVMFNFVWTIAFLTLWFMHVICVYDIILLPAVLVLRNTRVHICSSNHNNMSFYIKIPVNKTFWFCTILWIPNVDLYHGHIKFRKCFDNSRTRS